MSVGREPVTRCGSATLLAVGTYGLRGRRGRVGAHRDRHRHRHRRDRRGVRDLGVEPRRRAGPDRRARHRPAGGARRQRPVRRAPPPAGRVDGDGPPDRPGHRGVGGEPLDADGAAQRRSPTTRTGLDVLAAETDLLDHARRHAGRGRVPQRGLARPAGGRARVGRRPRLGITDLDDGPGRVDRRRAFAVIGILDPLPLHPGPRPLGVDRRRCRGALPRRRRDPDPHLPARRSRALEDVRARVLGRTVNPAAPNEVDVSRPSDALEARARVDEGLRRLLLGLGAVALVVGGVGVANVMVISVLERRSEIGLRRALGADPPPRAPASSSSSRRRSPTIGGLLGVGLRRRGDGVVRQPPGLAPRRPARRARPVDLAALLLGVLAGLYPASVPPGSTRRTPSGRPANDALGSPASRASRRAADR